MFGLGVPVVKYWPRAINMIVTRMRWIKEYSFGFLAVSDESDHFISEDDNWTAPIGFWDDYDTVIALL